MMKEKEDYREYIENVSRVLRTLNKEYSLSPTEVKIIGPANLTHISDIEYVNAPTTTSTRLGNVPFKVARDFENLL